MRSTLKVRDHTPICFEETTEKDSKFKLCEGAEASWLTQSQTFGIQEQQLGTGPME